MSKRASYAAQELTEKDTNIKRFGVRGFKQTASLEKTLKLATDAGMTWTRLELHWDLIEAEKGKYEWQAFDKTLADILGKKLKVVITIRSYSKWASKKPN